MDIIQLLPDSVANQIAAGEVIQRPASVIKELVENAIDAGATQIKVLVNEAGKASIQVIDNGCGMSDTDARLSFERHATSKIRQAVDLFSLHTMGFRGEALASIAAVAQVTLQTRTIDNEVGTRLRIDGSKFIEQEVVSCPVGSNFLIENLFFNIPARRKFLKSNATEMTNITQAFERIVLVYPQIEFSLFSNGQEVLNLRAHSAGNGVSSSFHQRIADVFGKRLNQQLLSVEADTTICKISGFVGKPESAKRKGVHQFFFVNGRYMKHPYFHKAVMTAYDRLLPEGEQIPYFINFEVNPEDIDVNIHPVKTEIKFENEQVIWQILMASVRDSVGRFSEVTSLDFDTVGKPDIPVFNPDGGKNVQIPKIDFNPSYNPFDNPKKSPDITAENHKMTMAKGWEELFHDVKPKAAHTDNFTMFDGKNDAGKIMKILPGYDDSCAVMQYSGRYIVVSLPSSIALIDQHRASVRVLFEHYMKNITDHNSNTQKVLFEDVVQFPPSYSSSMQVILSELRGLGFEITDLGGGSYSIGGIPAGIKDVDPLSLVNNLVSDAFEQGLGATEQIHSLMAQNLAERVAIPYGEILNEASMRDIVRQLLLCSTQRYTPGGKNILSLILDDEIDRKMN